MNPLLATGALSLAGDLVQTLLPRPAAPAVEKTAFAEVLARVSASPQMQQARWLAARGLHTAEQAATRVHTLTEELLQSPELHAATAGSGASFTLSLQPDGQANVRTADGRERTITLPENTRQLAEEIRNVARLSKAESGAASAVSTLESRATSSTVLHITPGARVSFTAGRSAGSDTSPRG